MAMKRLSLGVLLAFCFASYGCGFIYGPVKEAEAFVAAKDEILTKWQDIAKKNATQAGMDEAKKFWNDKKADLVAKKDAIKNASQGINQDSWKALVFRSESRDRDVLLAIYSEFTAIKDGSSYELTKALGEQFDVLRKEFETAVKR